MYTEGEYAEELSYLASYARSDYLGMGVIVGSVAHLIRDDWNSLRERELALRLIGDLLDLGASAGDLSADPGQTLIPWGLDRLGILARIEEEWHQLGRSPDSGEICWILHF